MRSPADASFARFQRTRDPVALAAVFDATAPGLLLVAMHLCGDAADAEDLVQTVFLQAIRDAGSYDAGQPVLPWLLGILEHRASDLRRRAHRRRERSPDAVAQLAAPAAQGPDRAAASAEVLHQVASAIESLEPMYREVLTLRLVHGLRAVDIARAQGISPETVRTRIKRGLALLRRCLPKSLARPLVLALLASESLRAGSGLAAVKQAILQTLPAATGMAIGKWLLACAAALAAGLAWMVVPHTEQGVNGGASPSDARSLVGDAGPQRELPSSSAAQPPADAMTGRREAATGDGGTDATSIRGRLVAEETGLPLAGATAHLRAWMNQSSLPVPDDWPLPADVVTSDDGAFGLQFVPRSTIALEVHFTCPGRVMAVRYWESLRNGITVEVGDVPMQVGTPFQLRVLEEPDRPCPGLEVFGALAADYAANQGMEGFGRTDADGIVTRATSPVGRWTYRIDTPLAGAKEGEFELPLQSTTFVHTVVLHRPPPSQSISGHVCDGHGIPVADLDLALPFLRGHLPARTGSDGSFLFSLSSPPEGPNRFHVQLLRNCWELELVDDGGEASWGSNDLRLVVRARQPASLALTVVDASTGKAVERFGARCRPDLGEFGCKHLQRTAPEDHPGGTVHFDRLAPGAYRICLFPAEPLVELLERRFELREGEVHAETIALPVLGQLRVEVVDSSQHPVAGIDLTLARILPEDKARGAAAGTHRFTRTVGGFSGGVGMFELDRAVSDDHGMACLRAARDTPALAVLAGGDRCIPTIAKDVPLHEASNSLRIQVETAAMLSGTVRPVELLRRFGPGEKELALVAEAAKVSWPDPDRSATSHGSVWLRRNANDSPVATAHIMADGSFRMGSLPDGRYELWLNLNTTAGLCGPFAVVDLRGGEAKTVEVDASAWLPAHVVAHFFVDGAAWNGRAGFVHVPEGGWWSEANADATGTVRSPWLLPGSWLPFAAIEQDQRKRMILGTVPIVLRPGAEVEITAALVRRRVTVTLLDADGHPAAGRRVALETLDCPDTSCWYQGTRTDDRGVASFDPAPPGRLRLRAFAAGQDPNDAYQHPAAIVLGELGAEENAATARLPR